MQKAKRRMRRGRICGEVGSRVVRKKIVAQRQFDILSRMDLESKGTKTPVRLSFKYERDDYVRALNAHHGSRSALTDGALAVLVFGAAMYCFRNWGFGWPAITLTIVAILFPLGRFLLPHL